MTVLCFPDESQCGRDQLSTLFTWPCASQLFLFPKVKPIFKWRFFFINDNEKNVTTELDALPLGTPLVTTLCDL
jgi:hypothetical protein